MGRRVYFLLFALLGFCLSARAGAPNVVVTIKPVHSLVAGVMAGVKLPLLLLSGKKSPHTHPLAPAEVQKIEAAQVIVWVGPSYETPLRRAIESAKGRQHVITLLDQPEMKLYPMRQGGLWGNHDHSQNACEQSERDAHHDHDPSSRDGHLWLDPCNAKVIVKVIAQKLSDLDPLHKTTYLANSEKIIKRLKDLDEELKVLLMPVRDKPYVVYHDGTQYFDRHFETNGVGALIGDGYYGVNAQHVLQILEYIQTRQVQCIFTEPQFPTDKIHSLRGSQAGTRVKTLDYLGVSLKADENAYFVMMRQLANAFLEGLRGS